MAAETEVSTVLKFQQVPVWGAMDFMTDSTAFDALGLVFKEVRTTLVRVAAETLVVFESTDSHPGRWFMRIMAGSAGQNPFLQAMPLIELKLSQNLLVAESTIFFGFWAEEIWGSFWGMKAMASCAVKRSFGVRTAEEARTVLVMTIQTTS